MSLAPAVPGGPPLVGGAVPGTWANAATAMPVARTATAQAQRANTADPPSRLGVGVLGQFPRTAGAGAAGVQPAEDHPAGRRLQDAGHHDGDLLTQVRP